MADWTTALALWANIIAVVWGIVYGGIYWNRDNDQRHEERKK